MPMGCLLLRVAQLRSETERFFMIPAKKYSEVIAKKVVAGIKNGVAVRDILGSIQSIKMHLLVQPLFIKSMVVL